MTSINTKPTPMVLSILIPAFNEEAHFEAVIQKHVDITRHLAESISDWEIIYLADCSQGRAASIGQAMTQRVGRLRLVQHMQNRGIYQFLTDSYAEARGPIFTPSGSDGQWPARN